MASPFKFKVTGRKSILRQLRKLGPAARVLALDATKGAGKTYERALRRRAPVLTGKGKRSMESKTKVKKDVVLGWAGPGRGGAHLVFSEYGFFNKRTNKKVEARPWARPTFHEETPGVERKMLDDLKKGVEIAARIRGVQS